MLGSNFYHGTTRKYITIFGALFQGITIERTDGKSIEVPIAYGPKERYLTRAQQNPDLQRPVNLVYPRIAYELLETKYAADRKLNSAGFCTTGSSSAGTLKVQNNPAPYDYHFRLEVIARNTDDGLQIVEQILPFFTPILTVSANLIPEMNYAPTQIPITLNSVNQQEVYEGSFTDPEHVIWTLDFTLNGYVYGPITSSKVIKEVFINFYTPSTNTASQGPAANTSKAEHIYVRPGLTANGTPTSNSAASVPVTSITSNSNYGYIVNILNG